jgi:SAM-dependent methyltransferase
LSRAGNPSPAYLFRRHLACRLLETVPPGRFLEIGVGSGRLYEDLKRRGFSGLCLDLSEDLIQDHQRHTSHAGSTVVFQVGDFFLLREQFDLLIAFEVLEHYEADDLCLAKWVRLLRPQGTLIFSVPAHMRQWTRNDTRAGHARRYEKTDLIRKLSASHLHLDTFWCYGFPVLNLTYPLSSVLMKSQEEDLNPMSGQQRAIGSRGLAEVLAGQDAENATSCAADLARTSQSGRPKFSRASSWFFQEWLWMPFLQLQRVFLKADLGTGYIVKCRRE